MCTNVVPDKLKLLCKINKWNTKCICYMHIYVHQQFFICIGNYSKGSVHRTDYKEWALQIRKTAKSWKGKNFRNNHFFFLACMHNPFYTRHRIVSDIQPHLYILLRLIFLENAMKWMWPNRTGKWILVWQISIVDEGLS